MPYNFFKALDERLQKTQSLKGIQEYEDFFHAQADNTIESYIKTLKGSFLTSSPTSQDQLLNLLEEKFKLHEISQEECTEFANYFKNPSSKAPLPKTLKFHLPEIANISREINFSLEEKLNSYSLEWQLHENARNYFRAQRQAIVAIIQEDLSTLSRLTADSFRDQAFDYCAHSANELPSLKVPLSMVLSSFKKQVPNVNNQVLIKSLSAAQPVLSVYQAVVSGKIDPSQRKFLEETIQQSDREVSKDVMQTLATLRTINQLSDSCYYIHYSNGSLSSPYPSYREAREAVEQFNQSEYKFLGLPVPSPSYILELPMGKELSVSEKQVLNQFTQSLSPNNAPNTPPQNQWPQSLRSIQNISEGKEKEIQVNPDQQGILLARAIKQVQELKARLENNVFLKLIDAIRDQFPGVCKQKTQTKIEHLTHLEIALAKEYEKAPEKQRTVGEVLQEWMTTHKDKMAVLNQQRFSIFSEKTHTTEALEKIQKESEQQHSGVSPSFSK